MSLCEISGLIKKTIEKPENFAGNIKGIRIKSDMIDEVKKIVLDKYDSILPYNFGYDLPLWIDYIGNPSHKFPPFDMELISTSPADIIVSVVSNDRLVGADELSLGESITVPLFDGDEYELTIYDSKTGKKSSTNVYTANKNNNKQLLTSNSNTNVNPSCLNTISGSPYFPPGAGEGNPNCLTFPFQIKSYILFSFSKTVKISKINFSK